ncbi:hypothetical protein M2164_005911 [Streptomyces sp. SAI-208]|uniref:hypothetical protein n=1 Tax=Streptomyces sp. SAI-208 TaxID=2940550 RepID=UPI00247579C4|nr:hypothetical protein [Streptomyces sp. SAI-208]MDH6610276.1 hypothetical protein [Streptomyces sp. SAI-208]
MGIKDKLFGSPEAVAAHREASRDLERFNNPDTDDTDPGYLAANERKGETAKNVPWYRR